MLRSPWFLEEILVLKRIFGVVVGALGMVTSAQADFSFAVAYKNGQCEAPSYSFVDTFYQPVVYATPVYYERRVVHPAPAHVVHRPVVIRSRPEPIRSVKIEGRRGGSIKFARRG